MTWAVALVAISAIDAGSAAPAIELTAEHLELLQKERRAVYSGHAKAVRGTTTLTCDRLEVLLGSGDDVATIVATGHVVAVDGDRAAQAERAEYDNATGVLRLTGSPAAQQGRRHVTGDEVSWTTGDDVVVVQHARTVAQGEADGGTAQRIVVDADRLTLRNKENSASWTGHVKARRGATTLLAPELRAFYDDAGAVTHVEAQGGVEATERDRWVKGQRATYDAASGLLVVTGHPEARQGNHHLRGTKVTVFTDREFIEVENATTVLRPEKRKP